MCSTNHFPDVKPNTDEVGEQMVQWLNHAATVQMISIGHQTHLFDYMDGRDPETAAQIATGTGLNKRYVEEWLKGITVGGIAEYDADKKTFKLKDSYADWLTRKAGANNLAAIAQYFPMGGAVEEDILNGFKTGAGVPYEKYKRFHQIMAEDSGNAANAILIDEAIHLSPKMVEILKAGVSAFEFGCGSGNHLLLLAKHFPKSQFLGVDLCEEPILQAKKRAVEQNLDNVIFRVGDISKMGFHQQFDVIFAFDAIHDQAFPDQILKKMNGLLRDGGVFFVADIDGSSHLEKNYDHPLAPLFYTISTMHCMPVSLAQGGVGLGTMWGNEMATELLNEAGFTNVEIHRLEGDIQNCYYVVTK